MYVIDFMQTANFFSLNSILKCLNVGSHLLLFKEQVSDTGCPGHLPFSYMRTEYIFSTFENPVFDEFEQCADVTPPVANP